MSTLTAPRRSSRTPRPSRETRPVPFACLLLAAALSPLGAQHTGFPQATGATPAHAATPVTPGVSGPDTTGQPPGGTRWVPPRPGELRVVNGFAPPTSPWGPGHRGVDLAGGAGAAVRAAGNGVVVYAGPVAGRGVVSVQHGVLRTTYEPVRAAVEPGEPVRAGQQIGVLVRTGSHCLPRPCLHWGLRDGETYLNPLALLGRLPVRLLPVWGVPEPAAAPAAEPVTGP